MLAAYICGSHSPVCGKQEINLLLISLSLSHLPVAWHLTEINTTTMGRPDPGTTHGCDILLY